VTFQILVWIGRRVSDAVEERSEVILPFEILLCVRKVLLNDDHKTKHRSRLIPKYNMNRDVVLIKSVGTHPRIAILKQL